MFFNLLMAEAATPPAPDLVQNLQHWQQIVSVVIGIATGSIGSIALFIVNLRKAMKSAMQPVEQSLKPMETAVPKALKTVEAHKEASEVAHAEEKESLMQLKEEVDNLTAAGVSRDEKLETMDEKLENLMGQIAEIQKGLNRVSSDTSVIFTHIIESEAGPRATRRR